MYSVRTGRANILYICSDYIRVCFQVMVHYTWPPPRKASSYEPGKPCYDVVRVDGARQIMSGLDEGIKSMQAVMILFEHTYRDNKNRVYIY